MPHETGTAYPPTLTPLPVRELLRELHTAVVKSEDHDDPERLRYHVLMAVARFECEMGGVL